MTNKARSFITSAALVFASALSLPAAEPMPSSEEMWRLIQQQQKQIEELTRRLEATATRTEQVAQQSQAVEQKVDTTASHVENLAADGAGAGDSWFKNTSVGGYGELHYNNGASDQIDLHRFVLFVNHEFSEKIRLFSELEVEHAFSGEGKPGIWKIIEDQVPNELSRLTPNSPAPTQRACAVHRRPPPSRPATPSSWSTTTALRSARRAAP